VILLRFKGYTVICDDCFEEFNEWDDSGYEDECICLTCGAKRMNNYLNSPCRICGKPMGHDKQPFFNVDGEPAHGKCIETLSEEELEKEEWSDEYY